ncbi:MAG TPA: UDP-2,3-diacylglucosamine diphosphatase [Bacteroidia bacterium]|nr:UDP-2,3-diacylglucosamine diphosphatase [Bacteroidia bacterium]
MIKRKVQLVVISDVHLGTYGCHAKELNRYLKSIEPETLVLNGDIIDIWQFSKYYWPDSHMKVVQRIFKLLATGTKVYYLTGNHDELVRKFGEFSVGNLEIDNKLKLDIDGKKAWIFHGDIFDVTMKHSRWLAKLGAVGYDTLILINGVVNYLSSKLGRGKISLSKKIKNSVKSAIKFIGDFEQTATDIAIENGYDYVICGHIHQPVIAQYSNDKGSVLYLNSGDWIENLTALEYHNKEWKLFTYATDYVVQQEDAEENEKLNIPEIAVLYENIIRHTGNG